MPSVSSGTDRHCFRGKEVRARHNGSNAEEVIDFHNFLSVSQGLLATIVGRTNSRKIPLRNF